MFNKITPPLCDGLHSQGEKVNRYEALDGVRAIAAIGIVMMHVLANLTSKPDMGYVTETVIPYFTNFTLMFMMVSGFSMCCGYYERVKRGEMSPNDFYGKRYKRLLPFFALMVVLDVVVEPSWDTLCQGLADLTLCFNLLNVQIDVIGVGWFIGTVFVFYLLFPFFVFLLHTRKRGWLTLLAVLLFSYLASSYFHVSGRANIVYSAPFFVIGGMSYLYKVEICGLVHRYNTWVLFFNIVVTCLLFYFDLQGSGWGVLGNCLLFGLWLFYAIGAKNRFLSNRYMSFLSGISLEIYLSHMLFFRIVEKMHVDKIFDDANLLYWVTLVLVLIGTVVFSYVVKYHFFPVVGNLFVKKKL